jgi:putative endonuclease
MNEYFVYMLTNRWKTVLYTGVTNSLERRVWEHKHKLIPGFTKQYNCEFLVYFETYNDVTQAIAREKQIKGWVRAKKNALIAGMNPEWNDLSAAWYSPEPAGPSLRSG